MPRPRLNPVNENTKLIDLKELCSRLSVGKDTAMDIASAAGAVVKIGSRSNRYNWPKVSDHIDSISGAGSDNE